MAIFMVIKGFYSAVFGNVIEVEAYFELKSDVEVEVWDLGESVAMLLSIFQLFESIFSILMKHCYLLNL